MRPKERTEEQKTSQAPLEVKFGETIYRLPILRFRQSEVWREKMAASHQDMVSKLSAQGFAGEQIMDGLYGTLVLFPKKTLELIVAYAPTQLDYEKIADEATDEQVASAFSSIMGAAFPFFHQLALVTEVLRPVRA